MKRTLTVMAALTLLASIHLRAQDHTPPKALNLQEITDKIGYPMEAKAAKASGKVIAMVTIGPDGKVMESEISESDSPLLSKAVEKHIAGLKFEPARKEGAAVKSIVHIPFQFELPAEPKVYTKLADALAANEEVTELDLTGRKLDKLDPRIAELQSLRILTLDRNRFSKFPAVITKLTSLEELSIAENQLTKVPGSLKKLKNLKYLDVRSNKFSDGQIDVIREMFEDADVFTD